ncbi:MAG: hypothetical protein AAF791_05050 [Bacteroidota bacterium]
MPRRIDLAVVSYGGVGTTFLMRFLKQYRRINRLTGADAFKQSPVPLLSANPAIRFIYVHGDPRLAAASLFRRGFHSVQSVTLRRWQPGVEAVSEDLTLDEYARTGVDVFGLREHVSNWYETYPVSGPTLFVRYETMHDHIGTILDFAGIPASERAHFPPRQTRLSQREALDPETAEGLDRMYAETAEYLERLADVEIRPQSTRSKRLARLQTPLYRSALVRQTRYEATRLARRVLPSRGDG